MVVYPNPTNGSFIIQLESDSKSNVFVYNILGELVFEKWNNTAKLLNVNINSLSKGIYIIKVITGERQLVKKVVVE